MSPTSITCSFPMLEGQIYSVFSSNNLVDWRVMSAHENLLGDMPYQFTEPATGSRHFRVETQAFEMVIPEIES